MHDESSDSDAVLGRDENASGRYSRGRFLKGVWKGGPGRPARTTETRFLLAIGDQVTEQDLKEIATAAVKLAKSGDAPSRDWVSRFLLPDPARVRLSDARKVEARFEVAGVSASARDVAATLLPDDGPGFEPDPSIAATRAIIAEQLTQRGLVD